MIKECKTVRAGVGLNIEMHRLYETNLLQTSTADGTGSHSPTRRTRLT